MHPMSASASPMPGHRVEISAVCEHERTAYWYADYRRVTRASARVSQRVEDEQQPEAVAGRAPERPRRGLDVTDGLEQHDARPRGPRRGQPQALAIGAGGICVTAHEDHPRATVRHAPHRRKPPEPAATAWWHR